MDSLLGWLSQAVESAAGAALFASLVWGVLSIILSPCHLASIPLVIGFVNRQGRESTTGRAFALSSLFAVGILLTIVVIGAATAALGRMIGDVGQWGNYIVFIVLVAAGLYLLDLIKIPWSGGSPKSVRRKGMLGAFVLGLLFGVAVGPCTFAYMAPVLGVTFQVAGQKPLYAMSLLLAYGIGHAGVIVLAGTSGGWVQRWLDWNEASRGAVILRRVCGVLVLAGAIYILSGIMA